MTAPKSLDDLPLPVFEWPEIIQALDHKCVRVIENIVDRMVFAARREGYELAKREALEGRESVTKASAPKLIGWRTDDYLIETSDPDKARNWEVHHKILPIFEGDPYTKLHAGSPPPKSDEAMRKVLENVRACLQEENERDNGPINDTIWFTPTETLFDYIDAALAAQQKGGKRAF